MIDFRIKLTRVLSNVAWWTAEWYAEPDTWRSGYLSPTTIAAFNDVPKTGRLTVNAYDSGYTRLSDGTPVGTMTMVDGVTYNFDATRILPSPSPGPSPSPAPNCLKKCLPVIMAAGAAIIFILLLKEGK